MEEGAFRLEFIDPRMGYSQPVRVNFRSYNGGGVDIRLVTDDGEPWTTATLNMDLDGVGRVAVRNWDENAQLPELLVAHGILEQKPIGYLPVGHMTAPIYQMTRPAMESAGLELPQPRREHKAAVAPQPGI